MNFIKPGDKFICYLVRLSRWCGVLEVVSGAYEDDSPIFRSVNDPWTVRFKVKPKVVLDYATAIPIRLPEVWNNLSRTEKLEQDSPSWPVRAGLQSSLVGISDGDGKLLQSMLEKQSDAKHEYPLTERDLKQLHRVQGTVKTSTGVISVSIPEANEAGLDEVEETPAQPEEYESRKKQAALVQIGSRMGFSVWVPKPDRARVEEKIDQIARRSLLEDLPLSYDETTFKTIEYIDVLWLRGRRIVRAFEVEGTTSIFSGLLRMADLLALQPNIDIRLHIVAPEFRRDKVFEQLRRPAFSVLEKGPLSNSCSFLSYVAVDALAGQEHLAYMTDKIIEEYEEIAGE
jgi:hypothetical protein